MPSWALRTWDWNSSCYNIAIALMISAETLALRERPKKDANLWRRVPNILASTLNPYCLLTDRKEFDCLSRGQLVAQGFGGVGQHGIAIGCEVGGRGKHGFTGDNAASLQAHTIAHHQVGIGNRSSEEGDRVRPMTAGEPSARQ